MHATLAYAAASHIIDAFMDWKVRVRIAARRRTPLCTPRADGLSSPRKLTVRSKHTSNIADALFKLANKQENLGCRSLTKYCCRSRL